MYLLIIMYLNKLHALDSGIDGINIALKFGKNNKHSPLNKRTPVRFSSHKINVVKLHVPNEFIND